MPLNTPMMSHPSVDRPIIHINLLVCGKGSATIPVEANKKQEFHLPNGCQWGMEITHLNQSTKPYHIEIEIGGVVLKPGKGTHLLVEPGESASIFTDGGETGKCGSAWYARRETPNSEGGREGANPDRDKIYVRVYVELTTTRAMVFNDPSLPFQSKHNLNINNTVDTDVDQTTEVDLGDILGLDNSLGCDVYQNLGQASTDLTSWGFDLPVTRSLHVEGSLAWGGADEKKEANTTIPAPHPTDTKAFIEFSDEIEADFGELVSTGPLALMFTFGYIICVV